MHMICRSEERGTQAQQEIINKTKNTSILLHICDVSVQKDVVSLADTIINSGVKVSGLVNNAGVMLKDRTTTEEGKEATFATMVNGTYLLTTLLTPALCNPSRVVDVSSGGMYNYRLDPHNLSGDNGGYDGTKAYCAAKRAQVILSQMQAERLIKHGIHVNCMHPG